VIVDYVQLLGGGASARTVTRTEELGEISRRFKLLAKELAVPILLLSQLNRASEGREDQRPRMKDLRESGSLEQDADIILMIHRPDHKVGGRTELILEKQRNGPTGPFEVEFEKETTAFRDAVARIPEEQSQPSLIPEENQPAGVPGPASSRPRRYVRPRRR
jgi:replicative DNA helicase